MTYLTEDTEVVNEQIVEDLVADFDGFLKENRYDDCNAIIDNLRDLKEFSKGIELAKRLTARKMTVPANYGEKKFVPSPSGGEGGWGAVTAVENQMDVITKGLIF